VVSTWGLSSCGFCAVDGLVLSCGGCEKAATWGKENNPRVKMKNANIRFIIDLKRNLRTTESDAREIIYDAQGKRNYSLTLLEVTSE
jgi:hypothetical protein